MRKGYLNKAELSKLERVYLDLGALISKLGHEGLDKTEQCTLDNLLSARRNCCDLLWWQAPERMHAINRKKKEGA